MSISPRPFAAMASIVSGFCAIANAVGSKGAQFGMQPFEETVREIRGHPARAVVEHVIKRVATFAKGAPQSDDITCVAVVWNER
jgi:serine phosphatase RsbU (regulator of sigma subunit)